MQWRRRRKQPDTRKPGEMHGELSFAQIFPAPPRTGVMISRTTRLTVTTNPRNGESHAYHQAARLGNRRKRGYTGIGRFEPPRASRQYGRHGRVRAWFG